MPCDKKDFSSIAIKEACLLYFMTHIKAFNCSTRLFPFYISSLVFLAFFLANKNSIAQNIAIIESQSANAAHDMDFEWKTVATNMGMAASVLPQTALYDTALISGADALIVSSGAIQLTAAQITSINQFMQSGRSIYLQGEYDCSVYNTNTTFESIVNSNGGNLTLNGTISGTLAPMNILGTLGTTPNIVTPLNYFWYGCRANGCQYVEPFMEFNGDYFGFIFCPPQSSYGKVVYNTDQDWVRTTTSVPLMENILTLLTSPTYQCSGSLYATAELGADTSICEDSTLILNAGGSGFSYQWSTGSTDTMITVNSAGIYWVNVTGTGCSASDTVTISEINCGAALISFNASSTELCEKFCISFFDSSVNNPLGWEWMFPGGIPSSSVDQNPLNICYNNPGIYDVTLITTTANGNDTLTIPNYITVHPTPPFPVITQNGNTLTSTSADFYQWQLNATDIPGATNQSYTITQSGYYTVVVTDVHGCKNSSSVDILMIGIEEAGDPEILIYPTPSKGNFIVELMNYQIADEVSLSITNALGQELFFIKEISPFKKEIRLNEVANGVYFIEVKSEKIFFRKKVLIVK